MINWEMVSVFANIMWMACGGTVALVFCVELVVYVACRLYQVAQEMWRQ